MQTNLTNLASTLFKKLFSEALLQALVILLVCLCLVYLMFRPNVIDYDTSTALIPAAQTLNGKSQKITETIYANLQNLDEDVAQPQTWFPTSYAFFPYIFSFLEVDSADPLIRLNYGISTTYVIFFILGALAWIRLLEKINVSQSHNIYLLMLFVFLDWSLLNEAIGFLYEWSIVPIALLLSFDFINRRNALLFVILGGFLGSLVLFKYSLLVFSISIMIGILGYFTLLKKVSFANYLASILSFSLITIFLELTIISGNRPGRGVFQNIVENKIPYLQPITKWLIDFQSAALGVPWKLYNTYLDRSFFDEIVLFFFYISLIYLIFLLVFSSLNNNSRKYSLKDLFFNEEYSIYTSILITGLLWIFGLTTIIIFGNHLGIAPRYFVLPAKLIFIPVLILIAPADLNASRKRTMKIVLLMFVCLYSANHISNNYRHFTNVLTDRDNRDFQSRKLPIFGNFPMMEVEKDKDLIFISPMPQVLLMLSNYQIGRIYKFDYFKEHLVALNENDSADLLKLRFIVPTDPLLFIKKIEETVPESRGLWLNERIGDSNYFIVRHSKPNVQ